MNSNSDKIIPIYTTRGDLGAFMQFPFLYNLSGEWIGWIDDQKRVFSVYGDYIGWMTPDPRIFRKRAHDYDVPKQAPPAEPMRLRVPAHVPLAPQMSEISLSTIDVLDEEPELLPTTDSGELRDDLD